MRLKLVMIVKDEAAGIAKTLRSVREYIDSWCILDTGSTDGTQAIIEAELSGIPGQLHHGDFVDFATTRNEALDLAGTDTDYLLLLNGDDVLVTGDEVARCVELTVRAPDAYHVRIDEGPTLQYMSPRIVRAAAGWRYRGVTHEVLMGPNGEVCTATLPAVVIRQERPPAGAEKQQAQWERDHDLLIDDNHCNPGNARTVFYLAQTCRCLGLNISAGFYYQKRVFMGGWAEEVYASLVALAGMAKPEYMVESYLRAHQHSPHRAEPLCEIAAHYVARSEYAAAYLFARRAYELPYPSDILFVDASAYEWRAADLLGTCAYHVGAFEVGEEAARKAAEARPNDERLQGNLKHYTDRIAALTPSIAASVSDVSSSSPA